ncbi:MAG: hypothetical protein HC772_17435 [Leptolyngbyaceae cyanobacterium CRU_2_3]|nr:hypothetical protein [Leptolyngbyaceae cyanobacterium CRU_2_3]
MTDCQCSLAVYVQPRRPGDSPLQKFALSAAAVEGRSGVPSANITFPARVLTNWCCKENPLRLGVFQRLN